MQTNVGHHTEEGVLSTIVNVLTLSWISAVVTASVGILR